MSEPGNPRPHGVDDDALGPDPHASEPGGPPHDGGAYDDQPYDGHLFDEHGEVTYDGPVEPIYDEQGEPVVDDRGDPLVATAGGEVLVATRRPGSRRAKRKRTSGVGCLVAVVVLALVVGGLYLAVSRGIGALESRFGDGPDDYPGPGTGRVQFEVQQGDNATDIAQGLVAEDVVASAEAFTDAASTDDRSTGIQVGFYELRREMSAQEALEVLVDPDNLVSGNGVTVPEGLRVEEIVDVLSDGTGVPVRRFEQALENPDALGLPSFAGGEVEGYLFPATYDFGEDQSPRSMLRAMVARWQQSADAANLVGRAQELGYTPEEVMTVASLVEAEASRPEDRARVARVIYNRLEGDETDGLLQLDATVNYASGEDLGARTTEEDRQIDSPYNTYRYPGLPPTPIEAPGDAAIEAAANPADGDWFYYVTVDLATGETKFAETFAEHEQNVAELNEYCTTSDAC
ncbi:endolytic transglycosylase MltG [Nocardioides sp. CFH 31398]|uniref:endolytic transglycosylase MltG n=1 Tax=Nocardioides sp. CFH 31398 TaxID=2919579 RepID=UPI001F056375|nr:endolytic transglycosylase MltG [Nocardioides sp. CFH 31398]MCH1867398.1 endolytic transglycosylase MltG [Nocardioides sp. CFH 31398]MCH1868605.1 endolytic transglycosylase MltG [Nocardioides sp. CFH 31398]